MGWEAIFAAIAAVISLISCFNLLVFTFNRDAYANLDDIYFDLLRMRVEKPFLARPKPPISTSQKARDEALAWENHACTVWCFIETVLDSCTSSLARARANRRAWGPAVERESGIYRSWLVGDDRVRFSLNFETRVDRFVDEVRRDRIRRLKL